MSSYEDGTYQETSASGAGTTELLRFLPSPGENSDGVAEVMITGRSSGGAPYGEHLHVGYSKEGSSLTLGAVSTVGSVMKGTALLLAGVSLAVDDNELVVNWNGLLNISVSLGVRVILRGRTT